MADHLTVKPQGFFGRWTNPWWTVCMGLVLIISAATRVPHSEFYLIPEWGTLVLGILGLLVVGAAVWLRLAKAGWEFEDRAGSAGLLIVAAVGSGMAAYVFGNAGWDSFATTGTVGAVVAVVGAMLVLLAPLPRRLAITVLAVVHFGGIIAAVLSVPPPNGNSPFLVRTAWTYFYRHYLQFMYLNNAYHFYSPDPGPPSLLWFAIDYEKGQDRWITLPARDQYRTSQDYQRYLALAEFSNMVNPMPPPGQIFKEMVKLRERQDVYFPPEEAAPRNLLFHQPTPFSQHNIASYARYVANHFPSNLGPDDKVKSVKVYRVQHNILSPDQMAAANEQGWSPTGPDTYLPFYVGEFDAEGKMKRGLPVVGPNSATGAMEVLNAGDCDPYLYWAMPIRWRPKKGFENTQVPVPTPKTHVAVDTTDEHAGFTKAESETVYGRSPGQ